MPPDGRAPRSGSRRLYGLADSVALALLVHVNMTFPPPAMRGDLVARPLPLLRPNHGDVARARPLALRVAVTPNCRRTSRIRGHPARVPYSKWLSMQRSRTPSTRSIAS